MYHLVATAWNILQYHLINMNDAKVYGKTYTKQLLESIISNGANLVNNAYEYFQMWMRHTCDIEPVQM